VGKLKIFIEPSNLALNQKFKQELDLNAGCINIYLTGQYQEELVDVKLEIWVDANHPVFYIKSKSSIPVSLKTQIKLWRTEPYSLPELNVSDLLEDRSRPGSLHKEIIVEPDSLIKGEDDLIGWYHYNKKSVGFNLTNKLQGLGEYFTDDPILNRTFGGIIKSNHSKKLNDSTLQTNLSDANIISVYISTKHPSSPDDWFSTMKDIIAKIESISFEKRFKSHKQWWKEFWERSWIYASSNEADRLKDDTSAAYVVSRAYALQRFIDAGTGRGHYPIKFNGSIFTVPSKGKPGYADYRRWGPGYWWQNTRLPYLSMCTAGDFDLMQPLFKMYGEDIYKLSKFRTNKYFGFEGVYFPECVYFWGSNFTASYGWTPFELREDKLQESPWHKWEWVSGLELVFMMLDYYDHTQDEEFLVKKVIPLANDVIKFFDNFYTTDQSGKLIMYPSMACETWWDCTNPMPELAGLISITSRLMALPEYLVKKEDKIYWITFSKKIPEVPIRETPSGKALAPAHRFEEKRNIENPELYAVFPFRLFAVEKPNIELALNALEHRWDKGNFGWRQDEIFMTYLGETEKAKNNLIARAKNFDKNSRFPAFWGPNYDWTPDQDHGGVLMKTLQSMIIQADPYSKKLYLFPAWPKEWNVEFKLHAPYKTTIEGKLHNGKIESLSVFPEEREIDIILCL
jgi:hypothetical protein